MFNKMFKVFKEKLNNGCGGFEWNCDAINFYNAMYEMAVAGVITNQQWESITAFIDKFVE